MMPTAYPMLMDPSQIHLTMPTIPLPPPPIRSKSRLLDILKLLVGLLIALILVNILVVLVFVPRTSNGIDLRESNEKIAKLQRESNENIARLQREQEIYIENEHQKRQKELIEQKLLIETQRLVHQEDLTEKHRLEDQFIEQQNREQDLQLTMQQSRQQLEIEQRRLQLLLEEQKLTEEHRQEDISRKNAELLSNFMEEVILAKQPLNVPIFQLKALSLIHRFDPIYKSLLISYLYKVKLLSIENSNNSTLNLQGANLNDIDIGSTNVESGQAGLLLNYNQLALPSTNLINSSFEQISLNEANFMMSNMMGASFRLSKVLRANFSGAILSLSNFRNADVSQSNFSYAKIQRASFQNTNLTQTQMDNADLELTNFQSTIAIETNFSRSKISNASFQYADLSRARMNDATIQSANFYTAKAIYTDFTHAYMSGCLFKWADLTGASFKKAVLTGASFENANVQNVDFTGAILAGANITAGQLDVVLSITQAILPDGSRGKNKNLVKNGDAQCTGINDTMVGWTKIENVFTYDDQFSTGCVFQGRAINATLQQIIDIRRYERLIEDGQGKVYIEMQDKTVDILYPSVYMIVRFFDSTNSEIGQEISSLNIASSTSPKFNATVPCPSNTVELQLNIVFGQVNATVDNIYVTIE